jgi:Protein of unknown function (DUF4012)
VGAVQGLLRLPLSSPTYASAAVAALGTTPILVSAALRSRGAGRRIVVRCGLAAAGFLLVAAGIAGFIAVRAHSLLDDAERTARTGVDAAKAGDRASAANDFAQAEKAFRSASDITGGWWTWPARQVPLLAPQVRTIDQLVAIGKRTMTLATAGVKEVDPDRLRIENGRIDIATLDSYAPVFARLTAGTQRARAELQQIRSTWLAGPLADALAKFDRTVVKGSDGAQTANEAVTLASRILGGNGTRRYLVLFVTPAELRGSGGLIANYGVLVARNGTLKLETLGRGPDLDNVGPPEKHLDGPQEYLARYGKFDPAGTWENITMSPDFPSVARVAAQLFPQSGGGEVDGVISLDPVALQDLLDLTGPVVVGNRQLDSGNVVQFLYHDQYVLGVSQDERANLLGEIAHATFDKLTHGRGASPSEFANEMSPALRDKDLTMWFANAAEQKFTVRIGGDGSVPAPSGDSFGVIVQNAGANKLDAFLERSVVYSATVDADSGRERARAAITLHNTAPSSGLPDYVIGNEVGLPTGTTRLIVAAYSRLELQTATIDGRALTLAREREFDRNVYSAYVDIPAGASRTLTIDLRGAMDLSRGSYTFDWFSQVLPIPDQLTWSLRLEGGAKISRVDTHPGVNIAHQADESHVQWQPAPVKWSLKVALER